MSARIATKSILIRWLFLAPLPLLWCLLLYQGWLTPAENTTLDWRFRYRGELSAPVKIVYVDIDDLSLSEIGGWPWKRLHFRDVTRALIDHAGAKAVGIDVVFSDLGQAEIADLATIRKSNIEFARYLRGKSVLETPPPVVLGASFTASDFRDASNRLSLRYLPLVEKETRGADEIEPPELPAFDVGRKDGRMFTPPLAAFIDTLEGDTRLVPLFAPTNVRRYSHMSLELARLALGVPADNVEILADRIDLLDQQKRLLRSIPLEKGQLLRVNWFSGWESEHNPRIGFSEVLKYAQMLELEDPDENLKQEARKTAAAFFAQPDFKDAIVLIGPTSKLMQDLGHCPFDVEPVPKVSVHGNLVKTIVSGKFLTPLPSWGKAPVLEFAITLGLTLLVGIFAVGGGRRGLLFKGIAVALLAGYVGGAFESFRFSHLLLPLVAPIGSAFSTSFVALIWQVVLEEKQKGRIRGMFSTYLSPTVVASLIESGKEPELGGHDAEITPYFSDIQNFSSFSEVLSAAKLTDLLNEYLSACTDIVQAEGGTLDKYIGDAVVAMYGAPVEAADHALRACIASQRVQRRLGELREKWKGEGERWPSLVHALQTRIGLNTGVCMIGNMGSSSRFNYTMMGDNVNLAARMESGAKSWGVYTMCTEATRNACELHGPGRLVFRPLGRIVVKGRSQPVPIHEILGLKEDVTDRTLECLDVFAQGMQKLYACDWDEAQRLFTLSATLEPRQPGRDPGIKANASLVRLDWVAHYRANPPPKDWDGVEVMTEK